VTEFNNHFRIFAFTFCLLKEIVSFITYFNFIFSFLFKTTRGQAIIGYYQYKDKVRGCANDARRMKDALVISRGFNHENTTLIVDKLVVFMADHGGIGIPFLRREINEDGVIGKKSYEGYFLAGDSIRITSVFLL
jgi:hypothetical protein